ncbi:MAG TPA: adenosylcobinamide-GDP ribazoletransferase [Methanomicrobiales archaeon]|jgi:adenosylcobinamide-GDP ribazoletransferase|nr:adenosylcobinamide-GDP ribazoletransferase [Methanomicrobiales archaeon]
MILEPVIALLQFETRLPLGKPADLSQFAGHPWLYPLAGYVVGGIAALASFFIRPPLLGAAVALAVVLLVTGFHHLDGLLDFGDGLMAHGSRQKRVAALTDRSIGAGGVGLGLTVTLLAFAALSSVPSVWIAILAGEVLGRLGLAWITVTGRPFREGIHATLHQAARPVDGLIAPLLAVPLLLVLPSGALLIAGTVTAFVVAGMVALGDHLFGGVNGDVAGATHEIVRALVILALALSL